MAQVIAMLAIRNPNPFLAGYVNNRLKELYYKIYSPVSLRFVDITHFEGMAGLSANALFRTAKGGFRPFPGTELHIKHSVAKGFYCEIEGMEDITPDQLRAIDERMRELVAQDIPIIRQRLLSTEAVQLYTKLGMEDKVALLETRPHLYVTLYTMADLSGYFYGALAPTTVMCRFSGCINIIKASPFGTVPHQPFEAGEHGAAAQDVRRIQRIYSLG